MPSPPPTVPLLLAILATAPALAEPPSEAWDTAAARHLELTAESPGQVHEVRISPGLTTTLVFNAPLLRGGVVVEERERFRVVTVDETTGFVALLPSGALSPGQRLLLTVRFADGAVPASTTFRLAVHPTRAEPQVNVYRQPRSAESFQMEARQEHERAERCEARLAQAQTEQKSPGGLTGLIESGLVEGKKGIAAQDISDTTQQPPGETLKSNKAYSYRAEGRVAVALEVENTSAQPWTVDEEGAALMGKGGARLRLLRVWQPEPLPPGGTDRVVVEVEATEVQPRGTYVLRLGEASGPRTITLRGVTFP
ncbi:DUF2381 family protein [Archangium violaceum]|uniref:DUF2381 family protein n=1 Tax=Archangium violaceum TaxID=83451 RepID=UPI00194F1C90|nr:DUF2381 family protein [Archangium violaceum]QRN94223.1 DUF2381 family protein [Archangium violaceum]